MSVIIARPNMSMFAYVRRLFSDGAIQTVALPRPEAQNPDDFENLGLEGREQGLPDHAMFTGWHRYPRYGFSWSELEARVNVASADSPVRREMQIVKTCPQTVQRRFVGLNQGGYLIPDHIGSHRTFTFREDQNDPLFLGGVSGWVFSPQNSNAIHDIIRAAHFPPRMLQFRDGDEREENQRANRREEWLMMMRHNRVISWKDFEVFRSCRSRNALLRNQRGENGTHAHGGLHINPNDFPEARRIFADVVLNPEWGVPEGLSIPTLLSVRYFAALVESIAMDGHPSRDHRRILGRLRQMIDYEFAWSIIHLWALERYWNARVPKLSTRLLAFVEGQLATDDMDVGLPGFDWANIGIALLELTRAADADRHIVRRHNYCVTDTVYVPLEHVADNPNGGMMLAERALRRRFEDKARLTFNHEMPRRPRDPGELLPPPEPTPIPPRPATVPTTPATSATTPAPSRTPAREEKPVAPGGATSTAGPSTAVRPSAQATASLTSAAASAHASGEERVGSGGPAVAPNVREVVGGGGNGSHPSAAAAATATTAIAAASSGNDSRPAAVATTAPVPAAAAAVVTPAPGAAASPPGSPSGPITTTTLVTTTTTAMPTPTPVATAAPTRAPTPAATTAPSTTPAPAPATTTLATPTPAAAAVTPTRPAPVPAVTPAATPATRTGGAGPSTVTRAAGGTGLRGVPAPQAQAPEPVPVAVEDGGNARSSQGGSPMETSGGSASAAPMTSVQGDGAPVTINVNQGEAGPSSSSGGRRRAPNESRDELRGNLERIAGVRVSLEDVIAQFPGFAEAFEVFMSRNKDRAMLRELLQRLSAWLRRPAAQEGAPDDGADGGNDVDARRLRTRGNAGGRRATRAAERRETTRLQRIIDLQDEVRRLRDENQRLIDAERERQRRDGDDHGQYRSPRGQRRRREDGDDDGGRDWSRPRYGRPGYGATDHGFAL